MSVDRVEEFDSPGFYQLKSQSELRILSYNREL